MAPVLPLTWRQPENTGPASSADSQFSLVLLVEMVVGASGTWLYTANAPLNVEPAIDTFRLVAASRAAM